MPISRLFHVSDDEMEAIGQGVDAYLKKGRNYLVIACIVSFSVYAMSLVQVISQDGSIIAPTIKLIFTAILCYFLYGGYNWARWICAFFSAAGGLFGASAVYEYGILPLAEYAVLSCILIVTAVFLVFSKSVQVFIKVRTRERLAKNGEDED